MYTIVNLIFFVFNFIHMKKFLAFVLMLVLAQPYIALAAPLTGANADVGIYYFCDGGGCINDTDDVNNRGTISWGFLGNDHDYVGNATQFESIVIDIQSASGMASIVGLNIEFYNGSAWVTLTSSAEADNPFQYTGLQTISFTPPALWAPGTPEEDGGATSAYYIRISDGSQGAAINQISINTVSGGGSGVPEFSDFLYITTLGIAGVYIYSKTQRGQQNFV